MSTMGQAWRKARKQEAGKKAHTKTPRGAFALGFRAGWEAAQQEFAEDLATAEAWRNVKAYLQAQHKKENDDVSDPEPLI